ncbi:uncharacterized protein LOC141850978 [Brevipalpus obovatus]|uniref:uncharacterized protein LOC141850978 n=1 Tax=Brevipalpus obovatus TaxID=246614 RepID=UPI003D9F4EA3
MSPVPPLDYPQSSSSQFSVTFKCDCSHTLAARTVGFLADWISAYVFLKGNKERLVLYFLISFFGTCLCIFLVLSIRLYIQKRRLLRILKSSLPGHSPISEIIYDRNRDPTLDNIVDISAPTTSQTTLNQGIGRTISNTHTQTNLNLESQYQPLLSPNHSIGMTQAEIDSRYSTVPSTRRAASLNPVTENLSKNGYHTTRSERSIQT